MVAYKLSKKYWVMHFIAIFRPVREKLLVTVALDHPVSMCPFSSILRECATTAVMTLPNVIEILNTRNNDRGIWAKRTPRCAHNPVFKDLTAFSCL